MVQKSLQRDGQNHNSNLNNRGFGLFSILALARELLERVKVELDKENAKILQERYEYKENKTTQKSEGDEISEKSRPSSPELSSYGKASNHPSDITQVIQAGTSDQSHGDAGTHCQRLLQAEVALAINHILEYCRLHGIKIQHFQAVPLPSFNDRILAYTENFFIRSVSLPKMPFIRVWDFLVKALSSVSRPHVRPGYRLFEWTCVRY